MKKFKTFFYPIYVIVIIMVLMISFNIYDSLELFKRWGWFKYFSDLPFMIRNLMVFLTFLMAIEIVIENISLLQTRSRNRSLEREVVDLKAKLYDKAQGEEEDEEEGEDDEEEDDED